MANVAEPSIPHDSSVVSETIHTEDFGASWAWEDENGDLGPQHKYARTLRHQSGAHLLRDLSGIGTINNSGSGSVGVDTVSSGGHARGLWQQSLRHIPLRIGDVAGIFRLHRDSSVALDLRTKDLESKRGSCRLSA